MHVADAEADVADSPSGSQRSGNSGGGLVGLLARRFSRVRTFHGSYDEVDGSLPQQQRKAVSFSASHHSELLLRLLLPDLSYHSALGLRGHSQLLLSSPLKTSCGAIHG